MCSYGFSDGGSFGEIFGSQAPWGDSVKDNGNRVRRLLRRTRGILAPHHEDIHRQTDQLGRKGGETITLVVGVAVLDRDILALDIGC